MKKSFVLLVTIMLVLCLSSCVPSFTRNDTGNIGTIPPQTEPMTVETEAPSTEAPASLAVSPGNYIEKGDYKFSFEKASLYSEVSDGGYFKSTPEDGKEYLICFFEVENISQEDKRVNYFYISSFLDDYDIDVNILLSDVEGYSMLSGDLKPGKRLKGYLCFEVDPDWQKLEVTYTDGFGDAPSYDFIVTPSDIA